MVQAPGSSGSRGLRSNAGIATGRHAKIAPWLLWCSGALVGQGTPDGATPAPETSAELLAFEEIPVVFTASKFEQKATEAPAAVTVITAEDIRRYGYRTLSDILASVRGFYVNDDRNYDGIGVRGFGRPGDYNNRILLLIDGHRLNDALYDSAIPDRELVVPVALIDRIEIVRGPGSSLYGSSGFFAVINVFTKHGGQINGAEVEGAFGSFHAGAGRVSFGRKAETTEYLISGSYFGMTGEENIHYAAFDDPATNNGVVEHNDRESAGNLFAQARIGDFTLQGAYTNRNKQVPTASYSTVFNDRRTETRDVRYYLDLSYRHTAPNGVGVLARAFYDGYYYEGRYVYDYGTPGIPDIVVNRDSSQAGWAGAEAQVLMPVTDSHRVTIGSEVRLNHQLHQANEDVTVYLDENSHSYSLAAYIQDELRINDDLILNAGLRYDYYDSFEGTLNPRFAAIYHASGDTTLKGIYGRAFRAPTPYELDYSSSTFKPNPDLEPETIDTYEFVVEHALSRAVRGTASVFYYRIDELISVITDPNDGLLTFRNTDEVRTTGAEAEIEGRWTDRLRVRLDYSYQDGKDKASGARLTNSPRHVAHLQVDAELAPDWVLATEVGWVGSRLTPLGSKAAGYAVMHLSLLARELRPGVELGLSIRNLFDHRFEHVAGEEHAQDVLEDRGRHLWMQVTCRF